MVRLSIACAGLLTAAVWAAPPVLAPLATADGPGSAWQRAGLPRQTKPWTRFSVVTLDREAVLQIEADNSYGNLLHPVPADATARRLLSWRWRVDKPNLDADLTRKDGDDSPIKVCALFDLPLSAVPFVERQLLRLARERSGEPLPAATVCYVWDAKLAVGTVIDNAFSRRIRMIVLQGPQAPLRQWQAQQRDLAADFLLLFGAESQAVPPLLAIGVGADADNTHTRSLAHASDLVLQ